MEDSISGKMKEFISPERAIEQWELKKGDHVADFGAGHGYFTIPVAQRVGGEGKVYALDIQKSVLDVIRSRAKLLHVLNIECIWADLEHPGGSKLKDGYVDFVILSNIAFQAETKNAIFKEAHRILRPGGRIAVIEWTDDSKMGPPREIRVEKRRVVEIAQLTGFHFDKQFDAGRDHYGLIFAK